jgi:hypothetical protein
MKKLLLFLLFLLPIFLNSQTIEIDERKNNIYFANGIMNTRDNARKSLDLIYEATKNDIYSNNEADMIGETNVDCRASLAMT